ncbi:MAG: radical SAM family heme chaperone HemW, partial [Chloroflexota bacterium]
MRGEPLSVYIHVPFCSLKCSYCDFNSYANLEQLVPEYVRAMQSEMRIWSPALAGRPVPTVFFGGGTPSLLPLEHLTSIIGTLRETFALDPDAEITLEANPGTISLEFLRGLIELGVNRLSFGVQSFDDDELVALDRIHTSDEVRQGYAWAREAGFKRVNLDLIYGLTGQTLERWQSNVEQALALAPEHLSLYALTVEEGTKLAYDIDHGRAPEPDADLQADMWDWSRERLAAAGYEHYEISNWARPSEECRHNVVYWRNGNWLGLGPGAHSHLA